MIMQPQGSFRSKQNKVRAVFFTARSLNGTRYGEERDFESMLSRSVIDTGRSKAPTVQTSTKPRIASGEYGGGASGCHVISILSTRLVPAC